MSPTVMCVMRQAVCDEAVCDEAECNALHLAD